MTKSQKAENKDPIFYNSLEESEKAAWSLFESGVTDRKSYFHTPIVISRTLAGSVKPRTMVLRKVIKEALELQFHTDTRSNKIEEIVENNLGAIIVYDITTKVQLRIEAKFKILEDSSVIGERWSNMKNMSKECYAVSVAPGTELQDPERLEFMDSGKHNFTILSAKVLKMEWLYLCYKGNRRASFDYRHGESVKSWLVP